MLASTAIVLLIVGLITLTFINIRRCTGVVLVASSKAAVVSASLAQYFCGIFNAFLCCCTRKITQYDRVHDKGVHVSVGRCSSWFAVARVLNPWHGVWHDVMLAGRLYSYALKV